MDPLPEAWLVSRIGSFLVVFPALIIAFLVAAVFGPGAVVVAHDMRPSGPDLVAAFSDGVREQGCDVILIGLENVLIGMLLISALHTGGAAAESARMVMTGPLSAIFWIGVVVIGLIYPMVVHIYAIGARHHTLLSGISSGVGIVLAGLFLRYLIVTAGIPASL